MRPGKPLMHGSLKFGSHEVPVLGLPGNPVSSLICGALFLQPAIGRLLGLPAWEPPLHRIRLGAALPANDARTDHLRAITTRDASGQIIAVPMQVQDSSRLRDLALADVLIIRQPHAAAAAIGEEVDVIRLAELGI